MLHIIWSIILGFIAGAIANFIMHTHMGFLWTTILGIVGSIVGGLIARIFSKPADGAAISSGRSDLICHRRNHCAIRSG